MQVHNPKFSEARVSIGLSFPSLTVSRSCPQSILIKYWLTCLGVSQHLKLEPRNADLIFFFFNLKRKMCLFMAVLNLRCFSGFFSSCSEQGYCLAVVPRLLFQWLFMLQSTGLEHSLNSRGIRALLLCCRWDRPGSGIEPGSPASSGGFFTTESPGKPRPCPFISFLFIQSLTQGQPSSLHVTTLTEQDSPSLTGRLSFQPCLQGTAAKGAEQLVIQHPANMKQSS